MITFFDLSNNMVGTYCLYVSETKMVYIIYTSNKYLKKISVHANNFIWLPKYASCFSFGNFSLGSFLWNIFFLSQGYHFSFEFISLTHLWDWWVGLQVIMITILMSGDLIGIIIFIGIHFFVTSIIILKWSIIFISWKIAVFFFLLLIIWAWVTFTVIFIKKLSFLIARLIFVWVTVLYVVNISNISLLLCKPMLSILGMHSFI